MLARLFSYRPSPIYQSDWQHLNLQHAPFKLQIFYGNAQGKHRSLTLYALC